MRGWPLCLLATGCASVFGIDDPDGGSKSCVIGSFDLCANQNPNGPIQFTTNVQIATERDCSLVLYEPLVGSICVIYATEIDVAGSATVTGTGTRPLVLAATGAITIAGTLDVSSYYQNTTGAGADPSACTIGREPTTDAMGAAGGGAGGSFGGKGGTGGNGAGGTVGGAPGDPISPPAYPRGGCGGGASDVESGQPGSGGGALWLVAGDQIAVASTGRVLAAGAGGAGGRNFGAGEGGSGGLGGGSGGFLRIAAPAITISGLVIANGGGGGEGGDPNAIGMPGSDGAAATQPSKAGSGGSAPGGDGGNGAAETMLEGGPGAASTAVMGASGGGGGGGAGAIILAADTLNTTGATISPPAM